MKVLYILLALVIATPASSQSVKTPTNQKRIAVYTTADSTTLRLSPMGTLSFKPLAQPTEGEVIVFVDPSKTYQTFLGIGAALTDASAETFAKLSKEKQQEFLRAYFDPNKGIGYTLARTNIHSCDFSSGSYTYVKEGDGELTSFNINHDKEFRIPFIKQAIQAAGGKLTVYASPWSPPAFMKTNNEMLHGGKLKPAFAQSWATYYAKFIKAYEAEGIPIWGITIQNEPMATQRWESCIFTAEEERDFLKNYLGPTLVKEGLASKKIVVWDHNRDLMVHRSNVIFDDPEASKYAWGMGFHWYEDWSGGQCMYENVGLVNKAYPNKNLLFTEGCAETFNPDRINFWGLGEEYGRSMIHDFNNGTVGWTDWNILLDDRGGPNHVGNFCFAPVHAKSGELVLTNSYYYIGHFSKFIKPGAKRIQVAPSRSNLLATSFLNPDGSMAIVVMNQTNTKIPFLLWMDNQAAETQALPHSITTYVVK